jgi:hypothetical protein
LFSPVKAYCFVGVVFLSCLSLKTHANETGVIDILFKESGRTLSVFSIEALNKELLQKDLNDLRISFNKGDYLVNEAIKLNHADNIEFYGNGSTLHFPQNELLPIYLLEPLNEGDISIKTNHDAFFEQGKRYQIYSPSKKGDRLLEFKVREITPSSVMLAQPVKYMSHVKGIPEKSGIYKEHNFFRIRSSNNIKIDGFSLDGHDIGEVRGHTIYSGILINNNFYDARENKGPLYKDFLVQHTEFKNMTGRGVAAYATGNVTIRNCRADNMRVEVFELDHFTTGSVENNWISNSHIAIQLNDTYNSQVVDNIMYKVNYGINHKGHFEDSWVNTGNAIKRNFINFNSVGIQMDHLANAIRIQNNKFSERHKSITGGLESHTLSGNFFYGNETDH